MFPINERVCNVFDNQNIDPTILTLLQCPVTKFTLSISSKMSLPNIRTNHTSEMSLPNILIVPQCPSQVHSQISVPNCSTLINLSTLNFSETVFYVSRERLKNVQHQQITISHNAPALTLHDTMEMEYTHTTTVTFIADIKETIST